MHVTSYAGSRKHCSQLRNGHYEAKIRFCMVSIFNIMFNDNILNMYWLLFRYTLLVSLLKSPVNMDEGKGIMMKGVVLKLLKSPLIIENEKSVKADNI